MGGKPEVENNPFEMNAVFPEKRPVYYCQSK